MPARGLLNTRKGWSGHLPALTARRSCRSTSSWRGPEGVERSSHAPQKQVSSDDLVRWGGASVAARYDKTWEPRLGEAGGPGPVVSSRRAARPTCQCPGTGAESGNCAKQQSRPFSPEEVLTAVATKDQPHSESSNVQSTSDGKLSANEALCSGGLRHHKLVQPEARASRISLKPAGCRKAR